MVDYDELCLMATTITVLIPYLKLYYMYHFTPKLNGIARIQTQVLPKTI